MDFNFLNEQVSTGENQTYLDWIISGAAYTVGVSVSAFALALIIGVLIGALRTTTGIKAKLANGYFEVVRSIPFLALLFINFFVVPVTLMPEALKSFDPATMTLVVGIMSLAMFMSSRIAAQVTAGIEALPKSQAQAAKSLGFSQVQTYTRFLIPQALRNIMPSLSSEAMNTVKNSAVISTIGLMDLTKQAQSIIDYTAKPFEAFTCIVLGYLIINMAVLGVMKFIEMKTRIA
ncbi:amino acid ABC transporter permease [Variovorax sp. RB3P1]|uniref:amino acid ABC transporter permease n=1 Tax=Variovorax sp. RB3P1 TaxID=3443732 RepID=UPI003F453AD9